MTGEKCGTLVKKETMTPFAYSTKNISAIMNFWMARSKLNSGIGQYNMPGPKVPEQPGAGAEASPAQKAFVFPTLGRPTLKFLHAVPLPKQNSLPASACQNFRPSHPDPCGSQTLHPPNANQCSAAFLKPNQIKQMSQSFNGSATDAVLW